MTADLTAADLPAYRIPLRRFGQAAWYVLQGHPRDLGRDFRYLIPELPRSPAVHGTQQLPPNGPYVLVANHYERPGLWMGWSAMILGRVLFEHRRVRVRWVAISQWEGFQIRGIDIPTWITRFIFRRFHRVFGLIAMPPERAGVRERAGAVRAAIRAVGAGDVIGVFPEGNVGPTPAMIAAQKGSGEFLLALADRGAPIIPVGILEREGLLHINFGPVVDLSEARSAPKNHRDEVAREAIMSAVAALVPASIRGVYSAGSRARN